GDSFKTTLNSPWRAERISLNILGPIPGTPHNARVANCSLLLRSVLLCFIGVHSSRQRSARVKHAAMWREELNARGRSYNAGSLGSSTGLIHRSPIVSLPTEVA